MQAGHTAVVEALDAIAHGLGRDRRLLRHAHVGRPGAHDHDEADTLLSAWLDDDQRRVRVDPALEPGACERRDHRRIRARRQNVVVVLGEARDDGQHLRRSLALAEHGLRDTVSQRAMEIHPGEAQIVDGQVAQPCHRLLGRQSTGGHGLQELLTFHDP